jgi:hypothetical protein
MTLSLLAVLLASTGLDASPEQSGTIRGIVVNGSHDDEPIGKADVVLRAGRDGPLEPIAKTKTDLYGKFILDHVPLDPTVVYLPGADRDGVHYPGNRIRLSQSNPTTQVAIRAFDAAATPSPLHAQRHDIDVTFESQVLVIRETMQITNRSRKTYVGERVGNELPVTLKLSVPANFDRVTFGNEFYGRRFRIVDHQVVTDIPWPPGERELSFTFSLTAFRSRAVAECSGGRWTCPAARLRSGCAAAIPSDYCVSFHSCKSLAMR